MYDKKHKNSVLNLISKLGKLNPMLDKQHSSTTKLKISGKISKYHPNGVSIYDLNDNLILKFKNNIELIKHLNLSRVTVGKYLNSGLIYKKTYRFKVNKYINIFL